METIITLARQFKLQTVAEGVEGVEDTNTLNATAQAGRRGNILAVSNICQPHNLRKSVGTGPKPYGVRVSLKTGDPFRRIMGAEWHRIHWYPTARERDSALLEMARKHEYSRNGDKPALVFEKVENLAASRGL